jgi:protein-tyrosine kinase
MSRIEKALEKASQLRQTGKESTTLSIGTKQEILGSSPVFEKIESIIDKATVNKHIVCITDPMSSAAEQYKKIRARIFKGADKDFLNSLMVASALEGEGKTVTAINLAVTMAQEIDHTVLLIDADLRKPAVHTYLGLTAQYGLSDYLQSKVELSDVLIKTGIGKLVLLPAGTPPSNPSELLASGKMKDLVREMKYRYRDRYIIFDSPPLLTAADGLYLKEYIDGAIFVIQAVRTPSKSAAQALALLKGSHVFGTIYNNVPGYLSEHNTSYSEQTSSSGKMEIFNAAAFMDMAEKKLRSIKTLFRRDRVQAIMQTLKGIINKVANRVDKK